MKTLRMLVLVWSCLWTGISSAGTAIVVDQQLTQAQLQQVIDELNVLKAELKKAPVNKTLGPKVQKALDDVTALKVEIDNGGIPMGSAGLGVSVATPAGGMGASGMVPGSTSSGGAVVVQGNNTSGVVMVPNGGAQGAVVVQGPMGGQGTVVVQGQAQGPHYQNPPPPVVVVQTGPVAVDDAQVNKIITAINKESFRDDKMRVFTQASQGQYFTVAQVSRMVGAFTFEDDKVEVVRVLAPRIVDKQNAYELYGAFTFSSSKSQVEEILAP